MPNAGQVLVGASGKVWTAELGVTAPTNAATAMPAGWYDLGYVSEDGATFTEGKEITDIGAWQSFYPLRKIVTSRLVTVSFGLEQWNNATIELALGGSVTANAAEWKYEPPAPEVLDLRQLAVEWFDGALQYRLYIRRGLVSENVEINLQRTSAAMLPITFSAMDAGGGNKPYSLFTNDGAMSLST
jgi:hypothetical protein